MVGQLLMLYISTFLSFIFEGVRCEKCKPGFYGDKCKPCECPYSKPENNFADTCNINVSTSLLECQCKPGYEGVRCDQCADGYYGNPLEIGGSCKRCFCNGNIDLSLTGRIFLARKFFSDKCISTQKKGRGFLCANIYQQNM